MRVSFSYFASNLRHVSAAALGLLLLCWGCNSRDEQSASKAKRYVAAAPNSIAAQESKMVLLKNLTPKYAQEFNWPDNGQPCIPTWEGKDRQSIPSHLRHSPFRSIDSHESSPATFEYVIVPGCRDTGARRAAIFERPLPFERFDLPQSERRQLLAKTKQSPLFMRLESLWRRASLISKGPQPDIAAQSTIIHYARRNLFSLTFSVDTLTSNFETQLTSHTLLMDTGKDVHFLDLVSSKAESVILKELNARLSEQIEERNHQLLQGQVADRGVLELFHQAEPGSQPCKAADACTPTRFFKEDLEHFIVHPLGLVFYHDFGLAHAADAQTPLSEVLLSFHFLKPYLKEGGVLGDWGYKLKLLPRSQLTTRSL